MDKLDKLERLLEMVENEEEQRFKLSHEAMDEGDIQQMTLHTAEAVMCVKIRGMIEGLMEENRGAVQNNRKISPMKAIKTTFIPINQEKRKKL